MPRLIRRRYIAIEVLSKKPIDQRLLFISFRSGLIELFGECGASQAEFFMIESNIQQNTFVNHMVIVRCSHKALEMVKASISATTKIAGEWVSIHILAVSGTLKSLREKIQKYLKIKQK